MSTGNARLAVFLVVLGMLFLVSSFFWVFVLIAWSGSTVLLALGALLFLSFAAYVFLLAMTALVHFEVGENYFTKSYPFGLWTTTVRFEDVVGYYQVGGLSLLPFDHKLVVDTPRGRVTIDRFIGPVYHVILEQLRKQMPQREGRSSWLWPW